MSTDAESVALETREYQKEGARLAGSHVALIRASAITPEVSRARGYRTIEVKARLSDKGFSPAQRLVPGLLIPMFNARAECVSYQWRPDEPRHDRDGKPIKYETPYGSRVVIDIHPRLSRVPKIDRQNAFDPAELPPLIQDVSVPLIVTEGVRKGDSAVSRGLCAIALMGVSAWHRLPDWNDFPIKGRTIYVCFDSDATQKRPVWIQLRNLKKWLETRGAIVKILYLPVGPRGQKTGLDDFIAALVNQGISDDEVCTGLFALATEELRPAPGADEKNKTAEGQRPEIFVDQSQLRDK